MLGEKKAARLTVELVSEPKGSEFFFVGEGAQRFN